MGASLPSGLALSLGKCRACLVMGEEVWDGGASQGCPQCERGMGLAVPKDGNGLAKMSATPPCGLRSALGMSLKVPHVEVSVYSSSRWVNSSFPAYLLGTLEGSGDTGFGKSLKVTDVRGWPSRPLPFALSPAPPKLPICPSPPTKAQEFSRSPPECEHAGRTSRKTYS